VHKGSTQTNKRSKLGFKIKEAKKPSVLSSGAPDCPVHQDRTESNKPLSGFSRRTPLKITRLSGVPPDCPVCQRSNNYFAQWSTTKVLTRGTVRGRVRAQSQRRTGQWTVPILVAPYCPVPHEDKASNGRPVPNPNGWVTWRRTGHCPVRPSPAAFPNGYKMNGGYKYHPNWLLHGVGAQATFQVI
jgi:hypothetical protein